MLGRLCKWLRILGYDADYFTAQDKRTLGYLSLKEGRIILTRDHRISEKKSYRVVIIDSNNLSEQLRQTMSKLDLKPDPEKFFSRCSLCNNSLEVIEKEKVKEKVPPFVYQTHDEFSLCTKCGKIYWLGTHRELMQKHLLSIFS